MALFKIFKGSTSAKLTNPEAEGYIQPTTATDGYAYYDTSTRKFYINADYDNNGTITRQPINAYHADGADAAILASAAQHDDQGHEIATFYGHSLGWNASTGVLNLKNANGTSIANSGVTISTVENATKLTTTTAGDFLNPVYFSGGIPVASQGYSIPVIAGPTTDTVGTSSSTYTYWTGTLEGLTNYYNGLTIIYVPGKVASKAKGTYLNLNELGDKICYFSNTSALTTQYSVGTPILFTYYNDAWRRADYNANTNTLLRTYASSSANELPLVGVSTNTSMDVPSHTSSYKDLYGGVPATVANRPTVQLSTGLVKVPGGIQGNLTGNVTGNLTGNASSATGFASAKAISLTGNITGSGSGGNGNNGWTISTTIPAGTITNEMLAGSIANAKLINHAINVAGTDVELGGSITAATLKSNLGLDSAMHFIGVSSTAVTDGGNENPTISGYSTKTAGDVILYGNQEFIYTKENKWELFGDEGSYKVKQTAIADSDATTVTGENDTFVTSVIQNANGVISVSKQLVKNEIYLVNVTMSSITEGTSDKSSTQIAEALQAGKLPVVKTGYGDMAMMAQLSNLAYDEDEDSYYASFEYNDQVSWHTSSNSYATKATMVIFGTSVIVQIHTGAYLTTTELPNFLDNAGYLTSYTETDPTVPAWAKQATKPTYNLAEINNAEDVNAIEELSDNETGFLKKTGQNTWILDNSTYVTNAGVTKITTTAGSHTALSNATGAVSFKVPTNTSHLTNDSGFIGVTEATNTATALINNLDVSNISGFGKGKTLKTLTETDGKIAATFQDIEIAKSQISDFPSSMPASDVYSWAKQESKPVYNLGEITQASDIQAIEALTGTTGFLKKTAANTWTLDTNTYVTDAGVTTITTTAGAHTTISSKKGAVSFNVPTKTSHLTNDNNFITITEVTNAINNLDVSNISGFGANKTLATLSETNGKISATFQNISITKSQVSDFPTNVSAFNNDSEYITAEDLPTWVTPAKPVYNLGEITQAEDVQAIEALTDTAGLLRKTAANTWSLDTNTYVTTSDLSTELAGYLPLTGGEVTGDITLKAPANSDSPSLIFQRGTLSDTYNDWRLIDNGGILRFQERVSGSTAWASQVSIQTSGITANNVTATNNMYATTYKVNNKATIQYNSTTDALEFVFAS